MKAARKLQPDFWLLVATVVLVVAGVLMVFDASFARAADRGMGDSWYFVKRQIVFALVGFLGLFLAMRVHPLAFRRFTKITVFVSIILLGLVMVPGIGKSIGGAARWIPIGPFHLQPSELAKLAVVMYLADQFAARGTAMRRLGTLLPHLLVVGLVAMLVLAEPDMGTAAVVIFTTGVMMYVAGVRKRQLIAFALLGLLGGAALIVMEPYRLERVLTFLNPSRDYYGSGYQITHALMALATGGLRGLGLCEGREKFYIPAPQTDMIGATLAEEAGFIGMLVLLGLFILFTYRGLCVGHRTKSTYMGLLAIGITSMVSLQALMNIAVFTSSMPATGVPLPFISYGGSCLMVMLVGVGMVLSVSRHLNETVEEPEAEKYESRHHRRRHGRTRISRAQYRPTAKRIRRRASVYR
ncbi:MAG: putative lipid II flippase FtsW [Armatimonadetes bacterium]|nr:putative lipid II flippase FtsW [Armatimonadota bacterium]